MDINVPLLKCLRLSNEVSSLLSVVTIRPGGSSSGGCDPGEDSAGVGSGWQPSGRHTGEMVPHVEQNKGGL